MMSVRPLLRRFSFGWLAAGVLALPLAGCVTTPENPMTADQIRSLSIDEITVATTPQTEIWWGDAEREFAKSKGCEQPITEPGFEEENVAVFGEKPENDCDYDTLIESPEAKAYLTQRTVDGLRNALDRIVKPAFAGSSPAKLNVSIDNVTIVSGGQAVMFGGAHILKADFEVVDSQSGKSLAKFDDMWVQAGYGPGGLLALIVEATAENTPYERLAFIYANNMNAWLLKKSQ
jgi:hypothetical protein